MACDHSAPHSGVSRYLRDTAQLRLTLVCDGCGEEQGEFARVDYRPYARRFSSELAELTAHELGLSEHQIARVRFATLICDVGREQIPAEILNKRGPLNREEWAEIRRQPELGAALLSDTTFDDVREWILTRRERPDGRGYPLGLSGEQIPLEARILSVIDAYVAIISDRPYRPAKDEASALQELLDNAGGQFDAAVVNAFARTRRGDELELELELATA
jgi:HD-GYP domain-containing protein (c-di-GMP phosphodiesterase class II)